MADINQKLNILYAKLQGLAKQQEDFSAEIARLKQEIIFLKQSAGSELTQELSTKAEKHIQDEAVPEVVPVSAPEDKKAVIESAALHQNIEKSTPKNSTESTFNLEKFIGENLANKIGVVILILGVAIGTKYSIDHNLVTPLTRIITGYIISIILLGVGLQLKKKYLNLSAVLVSGAMASFYLVSYAAFAFFKFYPQWLAFLLLVLSTIGSIFVAISYKKQVIAQIGLVGAYAAPFLVSTGSNNAFFLFVYIAVINLAVLFLAQYKQWKELSYSSFAFTWVIFMLWYLTNAYSSDHKSICLIFSAVFYLLFHAYFVIILWQKKRDCTPLELVFLILNSVFVFSVWYDLLSSGVNKIDYTALFTIILAALNGVSAYLIYRNNKEQLVSLYLLTGFSIFLTLISIPMQFDGNWVPLLWIILSAILLYLARKVKSDIFEVYFYPVLAIAFIGFLSNITAQYKWNLFLNEEFWFQSVFNWNLLTNLIFCLVLGGIVLYNVRIPYSLEKKYNIDINKTGLYLLPLALSLGVYVAIHSEIAYFWDKLLTKSSFGGHEDYVSSKDYALTHFKTVWQLNWSLIFVSLIAFINWKFWKNDILTRMNLLLGAVIVVLFLTLGLFTLSDIRQEYLHASKSLYVNSVWGHYALRYISLFFLAIYVLLVFLMWKRNKLDAYLKQPLEIALHIVLFWLACSELLRWMDFGGMSSAYKTGLSVMGGGYALLLVGLGIWKGKAHLRIMAIILFAITLAKLFFYDISSMSMIAKTLVFITLGALLLAISFLYNKYKTKMDQTLDKE